MVENHWYQKNGYTINGGCGSHVSFSIKTIIRNEKFYKWEKTVQKAIQRGKAVLSANSEKPIPNISYTVGDNLHKDYFSFFFLNRNPTKKKPSQKRSKPTRKLQTKNSWRLPATSRNIIWKRNSSVHLMEANPSLSQEK